MPVTSGAKLVKLLRESGTGDNKLVWARRLLHEAKVAGKSVTADDVIDAMVGPEDPELRKEGHLGLFHPTIKKASVLRDTGKWTDPSQAPKPTIEEEILTAEHEAEVAAEVAVQKKKKD